MSQTSIELVSHRAESPQNSLDEGLESRTTDVEFSLPPADGGRKAYLFLAACWVVEAVTFGRLSHIILQYKLVTLSITGFGFSFGVFQEYYSHNEPFAGSSNIAAIGTTTTVRN